MWIPYKSCWSLSASERARLPVPLPNKKMQIWFKGLSEEDSWGVFVRPAQGNFSGRLLLKLGWETARYSAGMVFPSECRSIGCFQPLWFRWCSGRAGVHGTKFLQDVWIHKFRSFNHTERRSRHGPLAVLLSRWSGRYSARCRFLFLLTKGRTRIVSQCAHLKGEVLNTLASVSIIPVFTVGGIKCP